MYRVILVFSLSVLLTFSSSMCCGAPRKHTSKNLPNGISVGKPKAFDNRTLSIMLESLSQTLQTLQTQFVDQKALAAGFGLFQGYQSSETASNLSVSTLPIPGLTKEVVGNTGNVDTKGNALPDTTKTTTTATRSPYTPQAPALDTAPAFSGFTPNYGEAPSDLLSDQVNLTYQIFNLRMILERSLSDRLQGDGTRLQAVLGFNVTIDPPRTANDAVAVVEITLTAGAGDLSLVALMPQEKTYNSAALSTKSSAFAGSAVVKMIQVGYSQRRRGQTFYLYRDNDTVSYERMVDGNPKQIVFGWMFRPVLGRRSVSPGLRQLFAVAALPATDNCTASDARTHNCPVQLLDAHVRTFWKKYDAKTLTSFEEADANRAKRVGYALSLGLVKPELFESRYLNETNYPDFRVDTTAGYQEDLGPKIDRVSWVPVGSKSALISAVGNNFFTGTQVALGDKTYSRPADGLILKSNQAFDLTASLDSLSSGPAAVIGRYGSSVLLVTNEGPNSAGISIDRAEIGPNLSGTRSFALHLTARRSPLFGQPLMLAELPRDEQGHRISPLVAFNGTTVALPYQLSEVVDTVRDGRGGSTNVPHVYLRGMLPDSAVASGAGTLRVAWPFLSDLWTAVYSVADPASAYVVTRLSEKSLLLHSKEEAGFINDPRHPTQPLAQNSCWQLLAGDTSLKLRTRNCTSRDSSSNAVGPNDISVTLGTALPEKVVLADPYGATFSLDVPKATPSDASTPKPITLNQFDAVWIEIPLDDVAKAKAVEANQKSLKFIVPSAKKPGEKIKSIKVEVTRDLTAKPGNVDVTVLDDSQKALTTVRLQISCTQCKSDGDK